MPRCRLSDRTLRRVAERLYWDGVALPSSGLLHPQDDAAEVARILGEIQRLSTACGRIARIAARHGQLGALQCALRGVIDDERAGVTL
jgi:hypothetical protein